MSTRLGLVSNKWIAKWYRYHLNVERLTQVVSNFNQSNNPNRNQANLNRARQSLRKWTNKIAGTRPRTGIHTSPNRTRRAAERAILQEARHRIQETQLLIRTMASPRTISQRQTGRMRRPTTAFTNFIA